MAYSHFTTNFWDVFFDGVYLDSCPGLDEWDAVEYWVRKNPALQLDYEIYSSLFFAFRWTPRK